MADDIPPELAARFALRHHDDVKAAKGFTFAFAGAIALFSLLHLARKTYHGLHLENKGGHQLALLTAPIRFVRKFSIHSFPYFPSIGHALTVAAYSAANIISIFVFINNNNFSIQANIAARTGWLAMINMLLSVFLALKNTPLAWLTAWSYERLNILHRYSGGFAVLHTIIHAGCYTDYFLRDGRPSMLTMPTSVYGILAGVSFVMLGFSGVVLRPWWYELFYYVHVVFFVVSLVTFAMHQPVIANGFVIFTCLTATLWGLDRLFRIAKLLLYSTNNKAKLTPLPNGGVRISMAKNPLGAKSGKHCFLWVPCVRKFETHPFTISAMDPLEFVVSSHGGFTRELHDYAVAQPGVWVKASVEGSYGSFPDGTEFDKVVMFAGGTGASFTFGAALNILKKLKPNSPTKIIFIWTVRNQALLGWYANHVWTLQHDSRVSLDIFVTQRSRLQADEPNSAISLAKQSSGPQPVHQSDGDALAAVYSVSTLVEDTEKGNPIIQTESAFGSVDKSFAGIPIAWQRPEVSKTIRDIVADAGRDEKILVMGCGPGALMKEVRNTTADCIQMTGPTVELHCEEFGW